MRRQFSRRRVHRRSPHNLLSPRGARAAALGKAGHMIGEPRDGEPRAVCVERKV